MTSLFQIYLSIILLLLFGCDVVFGNGYHEFYLDIIQGENDGTSSGNVDDCTRPLQQMLSESVIRHAKEFFVTDDDNIWLDGSLELQVDHHPYGTDMGTPLVVDGAPPLTTTTSESRSSSASTGGSLTADDNNDNNIFGSINSYCCSHNHKDCGSNLQCNQSIEHCESCGDVWIVENSCSNQGGLGKDADCTEKQNDCCPGLECVPDGIIYKKCDRVVSSRRRRRRRLNQQKSSLQDIVEQQQEELLERTRRRQREQQQQQQRRRQLEQPQQQQHRNLYSSYWFKYISAQGLMRCFLCDWLNKDHDYIHGRRRNLGDQNDNDDDYSRIQRRIASSPHHRTLHPEYESYMSFKLTRDVRNYLQRYQLTCLGRNFDDIEVYFAQGPAP